MISDTEPTKVVLPDGQIKKALSHYKRVLADRERVLGRAHLETIAARGSLGSAYHAAGRMGSALQLYEQTRADYERVLGADHPDTLAYRANLAKRLLQGGPAERRDDAAPRYRRTL